MTEKYTCPMHPEIIRDKMGNCPKCGMRLVKKSEVVPHVSSEEKITWKSYIPLIVISGLILLTAITISFKDMQIGTYSIANTISYFMTGFFLVFSAFKLMDLKGFANGYSTYDLLAKRFYPYGFIYPFIELFFGLSMILNIFPKEILIAEIVVMIFSGVGVLIKLLKKERFQCSCLGTFLKVPLTKITLIEDFGMAILGIILLQLL